MRKLFIALVLTVIIFGQAWAAQLELIGGIRDGLALGIMAEQNAARNLGLRYGIEANTGNQPIIVFLGGKFYLTDFSRGMPLSLGLGFVGYFGGKKTDPGISISIIINRAFNINPLFIEAGVDVAGSGRLQLQVGYKIY